MSNPYAPPESRWSAPKASGAGALDALSLGIPALLCALHALAFVAVLSLAWADAASGRESSLQVILSRPLVILQPLCTLATALLLLLRRRSALFPACALPCAIVAYSLYHAIDVSLPYLAGACLLAAYVGLLAFLRRLS